ncbi:MAG: holo-ACP synthase [Acidiferrobacterales bacterium]
MIFGIGTDIVKVARMQRSIDRWGDRFAGRILTPDEKKEYCTTTKKANFLAKRFAAKEAASKAMGLGFQNGLELKHISVTHKKNGKPELIFTGFASEFLSRNNISASQLSLSDEHDYAVAFVTMECASTD